MTRRASRPVLVDRPADVPQRLLTSADGVRIAVYEHGDKAAPAVVAVHGYPDDHTVWDPVVELLAPHFHVVTYDVRGSGASDKPQRRSAYRVPHLIDDLAAVLEAVSPSAPVHLLGHDWGSIQSWPAIADDRLAGRIATFTSISGPSLEHSAVWLRRLGEHPLASVRQVAHSYYIAFFQLPGLPEVVARSQAIDKAIRRFSRRTRSSTARRVNTTRAEADKVNGISLYRANLFPAMTVGKPRAIDVPVQVIVLEDDPFVTPELAAEAPQPWVRDLTVRRIPGGHWQVTQRPDVISRLVAEFVAARADGVPRLVGRRRPVVLLVGAAGNLGRAAAREFARGGAQVVIADVHTEVGEQAAREIAAVRPLAEPQVLQIEKSDVDTLIELTDRVRSRIGTPDVLINAAGCGWDACRTVAAAMIARGEGGHIVNVTTSASDGALRRAVPVTELSKRLRDALHRDGIGITAVPTAIAGQGATDALANRIVASVAKNEPVAVLGRPRAPLAAMRRGAARLH